jgi:hypothetical protein
MASTRTTLILNIWLMNLAMFNTVGGNYFPEDIYYTKVLQYNFFIRLPLRR